MDEILQFFGLKSRMELEDELFFGDEYMFYNYDNDTWNRTPQNAEQEKVYQLMIAEGLIA